MATVTGYTAARMKQIEDTTVVGGTVNQTTKHLLLTTRAGVEIDAGKLEGPKGDKGDPGLGNVNTVNAKIGPDIVLNATDVGGVPTTQFATEAQRGIIELATTAEATTLTDPDRAITPRTLASVKDARWERKGSTIAVIGNGLYAGQIALLTLAANTFPVEISWTGARWEPISWRLSGNETQKTAFTSSGVCYEGAEWYSTTNKVTSVYNGTAWVVKDSALLKISPSAVSNVAGTISVLSPGVVRVTDIQSVTFDDVFTSGYTNYKILVHITKCTTVTQLGLRLKKTAGVISTSYAQGFTGVTVAGVAENIVAVGNSRWVINRLYNSGSMTLGSEVLILEPNAAVRTTMLGKGFSMTAGGSYFGHSGGATQDDPASMHGFMLQVDSPALFSGLVSVYGYN